MKTVIFDSKHKVIKVFVPNPSKLSREVNPFREYPYMVANNDDPFFNNESEIVNLMKDNMMHCPERLYELACFIKKRNKDKQTNWQNIFFSFERELYGERKKLGKRDKSWLLDEEVIKEVETIVTYNLEKWKIITY